MDEQPVTITSTVAATVEIMESSTSSEATRDPVAEVDEVEPKPAWVREEPLTGFKETPSRVGGTARACGPLDSHATKGASVLWGNTPGTTTRQDRTSLIHQCVGCDRENKPYKT